MSRLTCTLGKHRPGYTDPTGGDPALGGPVLLRICRDCGVELPPHPEQGVE